MTFSSYTLEVAYAHCERAVRSHYENFPVASLLLPKGSRRHVAAVYAFARMADDYADEPAYAGHRLELLAQWRLRLDRAAAGEADHPVFIALSDTITRHRLDTGLFHDLLSAFEQDVRVTSYETFDDLLAYCRLSANPVGRIVLALFGRSEKDLLAQSDAVCTGLQLANFWQDVAIDRAKGRCYIPREDLRRFSCDPAALAEGETRAPFVEVMRHEVDRTRGIFAAGAGLPAALGGRLGFETTLVLLGGLRILEMIEDRGYDVFTRRPVLGAPEWGRLLMRATVMRRRGIEAAIAR